MSRLRARCPACRTLTAVALDGGYECHSCGRRFPAGLVRIVRAWGDGAAAVAPVADLALPFPEAARIDAPTVAEQTLAIAASLPARTVVVGGCAVAHVGVVEAVGAAVDRPALVWVAGTACLDERPVEPWRGALRAVLSLGAVAGEDVVLVGPSQLADEEHAFLARRGVLTEPAGLAGRRVGGVVVAVDGSAFASDSGLRPWREVGGRLRLRDVAAAVDAAGRAGPVVAVCVSGLVAPVEDPGRLAELCGGAWT